MDGIERPTEYAVAIVVDPACGTRLAELARRMHVWICDSSENRAAVEDVWKADGHGSYDFHSGATIFQWSAGRSPEEVLLEMLDTVDLHHAGWTQIKVIGCGATPQVRKAFAAYGAEVCVERSAEFEVQRRGPRGA